MTKKHATLAGAVAAALLVLFPEMGNTIMYVISTVLSLVPQLTLTP